MKQAVSLAIAAGIGLSIAGTAVHGQNSTLGTVKQREALKCGVNAGLPGFSQSDAMGNWRGLDVVGLQQ